jgi:hypothetical protein
VKERVWENFLWHLSFPRVLSRVSLWIQTSTKDLKTDTESVH